MRLTKSHFFSALKYILTLIVASFLLYWVFKDTEWKEFKERINEVDYRWVYLSMFLSFSSYIARAYRWTLLINPFGYKLKTSRSLIAVFIGYLANLIFPRLGEITRCAILKKNDEIPMPLSIGTVITERVFDLVMLILLFGVTFLLEFDILYEFFGQLTGEVKNPGLILYIIGGSLILIATLFALLRKRIVTLVKKSEVSSKILSFINQLWSGFLSFRKIENKSGFVLSTIVIWLVYFLMTYVITFSMTETKDLGIIAGMTMLVGAGVALIIPVQGGFGTYHAIISLLLVFYGIEEKTGAFFAALLHSSQIVTIIFFGLLSLLISFTIKKKTNDTNGKQNTTVKIAD